MPSCRAVRARGAGGRAARAVQCVRIAEARGTRPGSRPAAPARLDRAAGAGRRRRTKGARSSPPTTRSPRPSRSPECRRCNCFPRPAAAGIASRGAAHGNGAEAGHGSAAAGRRPRTKCVRSSQQRCQVEPAEPATEPARCQPERASRRAGAGAGAGGNHDRRCARFDDAVDDPLRRGAPAPGHARKRIVGAAVRSAHACRLPR